MATRRKSVAKKATPTQTETKPEVRRIIDPEDNAVTETDLTIVDAPETPGNTEESAVIEFPEKKGRTAVFKDGAELRPYGPNSLLDPKDLTDEIAIFLLDTGRATKDDFKKLPSGWKPKTEQK